MDKLNKLLENYGALGHSDQHKENVETSKAFLDIINGKEVKEEKLDESADPKVKKIQDALENHADKYAGDWKGDVLIGLAFVLSTLQYDDKKRAVHHLNRLTKVLK